VGVVIHVGLNMETGHYLTIGRQINEKKWMKYEDDYDPKEYEVKVGMNGFYIIVFEKF
jgi:uncharacterized UBP type Zn finger protein